MSDCRRLCNGGVEALPLPKSDRFVMGDNRNAALDSRSAGPVPITGIYGKFVYRYWPISSAGRLD